MPDTIEETEFTTNADGVAYTSESAGSAVATDQPATVAPGAATGRRKVLVARGAYHGAVPWCSPSVAGVTAEDRAHLLSYRFNDVESLHAAAEAAGPDLAAVLVRLLRTERLDVRIGQMGVFGDVRDRHATPEVGGTF